MIHQDWLRPRPNIEQTQGPPPTEHRSPVGTGSISGPVPQGSSAGAPLLPREAGPRRAGFASGRRSCLPEAGLLGWGADTAAPPGPLITPRALPFDSVVAAGPAPRGRRASYLDCEWKHTGCLQPGPRVGVPSSFGCFGEHGRETAAQQLQFERQDESLWPGKSTFRAELGPSPWNLCSDL